MERLNVNFPEDFESLTKEELITLLRNIKSQVEQNKKKSSTEKQNKSSFDFCKYKKRHVALKFLYLGWDYAGFAAQIHSEKTIEEQMFKAMLKTKLIESRETSNYHRCGRTDKGVSAFSQVISLDLRSNLLEGKGVITPENFIHAGKKVSDKEIDYPTVLNRVLPPEIRVTAWAPAEREFSARFDCVQRTYKYWFPIGNLDISKMWEAGQRFIGEHDFRNFCKMDVANGVVNYKRRIFSVGVEKLSLSGGEAYDIAELTVVGQAYLYHQIRCIVSLLCLIGFGKEDPQVINDLLDIEKFPRKPQYDIASETPLVLFDCCYEQIEWVYDKESIKLVIQHLQNLWAEHSVKTVIIRKMLGELENLSILTQPVVGQTQFLLPGVKPRVYKRLLDRPCCESLEERIEHFSKKPRKKLKLHHPSTSAE